MENTLQILSICMLFFVGIHGECDMQGISTCFVPLSALMQEMQRESKGMAVILSKESLNTLCTAIPGVKECVGDKPKDCPDNPQVQSMAASIDAMSSLCESGTKKKYLKSLECMKGQALADELNKCPGTPGGGPGGPGGSGPSTPAEQCKTMNEAFQCFYDGTKKACGADAADVQLGVVEKQQSILLEPINCKLELDKGTSTAASLGWSWVLLLISAAIARVF